MEHLSALEAGFLEAEDADRHISLAIGGIAILDGPPEPQDVLLATLAARLASIPRFTQVLRQHPLKFKAPQWQEDPNFELDRHVRRVALPAPGDDTALFDLTADIMARRLDRERPLWECWVIEGLEHDSWAILIKLHHCIADGIAATNTLIRLFDDGGGATFADQIHGSTHPQGARGRIHLSVDPRQVIQTAWQASSVLPRRLARAGVGALQMASEIVRPAQTSLTGRLGTLRRYRAVRVSLSDVESICAAFEVTVNDVALTAIAHGFRAVLLARHEAPGKEPVRTLVPISIRRSDAFDQTDNRVAAMLTLLPVDIDDALERLGVVHRRLVGGKRSGQPQAAALLMQAARYFPFMLSAWTVRLLTALPQRGVVTLATNVPGPRKRHRVGGHTVRHLLPVPPIGVGLLTGVAILSYADELVFGIVADRDSTPDLDLFAGKVHDAVHELVVASRTSAEQANTVVELLPKSSPPAKQTNRRSIRRRPPR